MNWGLNKFQTDYILAKTFSLKIHTASALYQTNLVMQLLIDWSYSAYLAGLKWN